MDLARPGTTTPTCIERLQGQCLIEESTRQCLGAFCEGMGSRWSQSLVFDKRSVAVGGRCACAT